MLLRTTRDGAGLTVTLRDRNDHGKQARLLGIPRFFRSPPDCNTAPAAELDLSVR